MPFSDFIRDYQNDLQPIAPDCVRRDVEKTNREEQFVIWQTIVTVFVILALVIGCGTKAMTRVALSDQAKTQQEKR
jgi:hypothetical protein